MNFKEFIETWIRTRNVSEQCWQVTRHIPGVGVGGVMGVPKFITRLQLGRGQAILWDDTLQTSKQLHGHLTYFLPAGALRMGWRWIVNNISNIGIERAEYANTYWSFIAVGTFYYKLVVFTSNIYSILTNATCNNILTKITSTRFRYYFFIDENIPGGSNCSIVRRKWRFLGLTWTWITI